MAYSTREPRVHLEIGSRLENVELVQIAVEASLQQLAIEEEVSNQIGTAVREAVANAIKHGNRSDANKQVSVDFEILGNEIVIEVKDEGVGFRPKTGSESSGARKPAQTKRSRYPFDQEFMDRVEYDFQTNGVRHSSCASMWSCR